MEPRRSREGSWTRRLLGFLRTYPWATQTLVAGIVLSIVPQALTVGIELDAIGGILAGATSSWLLREGELFRLVTASFVHDGAKHLNSNIILVGFIGTAVETRMGGALVLIVALLGGMAGLAMASFLLPAPIVGASAIGFALLGALSVSLAGGAGKERVFALLIVAGVVADALGLGPLSTRPLSNAAHLLGFASGFGIAAVATRPRWRDVLTKRRRRRMAGALVLLYLAFACWGYAVLSATSVSDIVAAARPTLLAADANPVLVSDFARGVYTRPEASPAARETTLAAMIRLVDRMPEDAEYRHILFHLLERHDEPDAAARQLRAAFALAPSAHVAEHLAARGLASIEEASPDARSPTGRVRFEIVTEQRGRLQLDRSALGCQLDVVALEAAEAFALVRIELGANVAPTADVDLTRDERLPGATWREIGRDCRSALPPDRHEAQLWLFD